MMRPAILNPLFAPISTLSGVGDKLSLLLARLMHGNERHYTVVRDLAFLLPQNVVDRRFSPDIFSAPDGAVCTFEVRVDAHHMPAASRFYRGNKPIKVACSNDSGSMLVVLFNMPASMVKNIYPIGKELVISGRVERFDGMLQMPHPDKIGRPGEFDSIAIVEPIYPLTESLSQKRLQTIIHKALEKLPTVPVAFISALRSAHKPLDNKDIFPVNKSRKTLAMYEFMALYLKHSEARAKTRAKQGMLIHKSVRLAPALESALPYTLTNGQRDCIQTIAEDLSSGGRMVRLLQGDVGSGKTIVALMSMLQAVEAGFQAALMVPTELVATQHFETITTFLKPLGIAPVLLTGKVTGTARKSVMDEISSGKASIVVGTHALFQEHVVFKSLALVVVDEQHRFGVNQRMALFSKGENPHILQLSATPIPRSMLLMLHGDMDPLILSEKPANRKPITTTMLSIGKRAQLVERLKAATSRGEKAYWICPLIEDETESKAAAEFRVKEFARGFKVGMVHGKMPSDQRDSVMSQFKNGALELLVATTVVEVGVDVPDATIMIIEEAERFGLSQLHQLRGRVGRSDKQSYCVLVPSEKATPESLERLKVLTETEDGFKIAEADFMARGGGEVIGHRQSGLPTTRFIDYYAHMKHYTEAAAMAEALSDDEKQLVRALFEEV